jgi:hypothetical protein
VARCCLLQSVAEARLLLRDWLVIFTANYHRNSFMRASAAQLLQLPVSHTAHDTRHDVTPVLVQCTCSCRCLYSHRKLLQLLVRHTAPDMHT